VDWRRVELAQLARFKHWLEITPIGKGRTRSASTANAILTAVCELLRFAARTGLIEAVVAERLSEPRWLRFTPPGFDTGESGQFRRVRARALTARAETPFPVGQAVRSIAGMVAQNAHFCSAS
jgi:integrase/recombinase XerD